MLSAHQRHYLRCQYVRVKRRHGHKKAIVAVAHSILVIAYHLMLRGQAYREMGGDYFANRADSDRLVKRLVA